MVIWEVKILKSSHLNYAQRLHTIGELIEEIGKLIKIPNETTPMSEFEISDNLNETIERYKYTRDSLSEMKRPEIINDEHNKLILHLGNFIEGTIIMVDGAESKDANKYQQGYSLQIESANSIVKLSDLIVEKFLA
jgi:hypothetical protein